MLSFVHFFVILSIFADVRCTAEQKEDTGRHIVVLRDDVDEQHLEALITDIREADEDPSLPNVHCTIHNVLTTLSKMLIVTANEGALDKVLIIVFIVNLLLYYSLVK